MASKEKNKATSSLDEYIQQTDDCIDSDRRNAFILLESVLDQLRNRTGGRSDWEVHQELGSAAAKYMESLQRSTEQKVKLAALIHRREQDRKEKEKLNAGDKANLFDEIEGKKDE